ncbi:hypothetical protein K432DRAFT_407578, partial [Lepidopterella palustris CBS 459.81]
GVETGDREDDEEAGKENEEGDEDNDDDFPLPSPADAAAAVEAGLSLFSLRIPGVMTVEEVIEQIDLDQVSIEMEADEVVQMEDLVSWDPSDSLLDPRTLKGFIAEFAACVGPGVASGMVVRLGR